MCEILAPCGGMDALKAALACGASGVYFGAGSFNARQNATNFSDDQLSLAARLCHEKGTRCYLTVNTLLLPGEEEGVLGLLRLADAAAFDGIILQDLAVLRLMQQHFPKLPAHASTQLATTNADGVKALRDLGFSRVVLAREMGQSEIEKAAALGVELEVFVHGALCASVSGQCYYSALAGGRSANRGLCAQPCRLDMRYENDHTVLSLRDLCLVEHLQQLKTLGIASLKIEGRMKRPEYVAATVTAYRRALAGEQPDVALLRQVFSRDGFTDGYYVEKIDKELCGYRHKEDVLAASPQLLRDLRGLYEKPTALVPITGSFCLDETGGRFVVEDASGCTGEALLDPPAAAQNKPCTQEQAVAQLSKTGDTFYRFTHVQAQISGSFFVSAAALNGLRRQALEKLSDARCAKMAVTRAVNPPSVLSSNTACHTKTAKFESNRPLLVGSFVCAPRETQTLAGLQLAFLPLSGLHNLMRQPGEKLPELGLNLPAVLFSNLADPLLEQAKAMGVRRVLCHNLSQVWLTAKAGLEPFADATCNLTNSLAAQVMTQLGARALTLSFELRGSALLQVCKQIRTSSPPSPQSPPSAQVGQESGQSLCQAQSLAMHHVLGMICYGRLPLMLLRTCPSKVRGGCKTCAPQGYRVTDRTGRVFPVLCQGEAAQLENADLLWMADRMDEFAGLDVWLLRFTDETPGQVRQVIDAYTKAKDGHRVPPPSQIRHTRGLYDRGLSG